jgi:hypothetical protein
MQDKSYNDYIVGRTPAGRWENTGWKMGEHRLEDGERRKISEKQSCSSLVRLKYIS